jgi:protein transport protein SEC31
LLQIQSSVVWLTPAQLYISDLNNLENPYRLGSAARVDDIECLDWNKKVPHILVTGSNAGFVTVWDVKSKKESLTLNNMGRKAVSAVAWDPERVGCPYDPYGFIRASNSY